MADSVFDNLPRLRLKRAPEEFNRGFREAIGMYEPEGPLPARPRSSGKGGPSVGQTPTPPVVTSVWSASDAAANGMTLTNGGLTVTTTENGVWGTIRNTISHTSGKVYVEFSLVGVDIYNYIMFGLGSAGMAATVQLGTSLYSAGLFNIGNLVTTGFTSNHGVLMVPTAGDVWALAVDFSAGSVWIAQNNVWLSTGNPATASNPTLSFVPATVGALFAAISVAYPNDVVALQPTAASQKYAPPSGFSPWG
jgi:hypothetical protein